MGGGFTCEFLDFCGILWGGGFTSQFSGLFGYAVNFKFGTIYCNTSHLDLEELSYGIALGLWLEELFAKC